MSSPVLRVSVICTGNICRSPMGEVIFRHHVDADESLRGRVQVTSAGTANWHVGEPMDRRARDALDRAGYVGAGSPGAYADRAYLERQDLLIVMTREHLHEVRERVGRPLPDAVLLRSFADDGHGRDVADPYYGTSSDFDACCAMISRASPRLTSEFRRRLDADSFEA